MSSIDKKLMPLITIGAALFALTVLLSISADVTEDVQSGIACPTDYTYVKNATFPGGQCCITITLGNCADGGDNVTAFTIAGNTTTKGQEGLFAIANQTPNIGTLVGVIAILTMVMMVALVVRRRQ